MNAEDIRNVTFETARKGYVVEDVNEFLQEVADIIESKDAEINRLKGGQSNTLNEALQEKERAVAECEESQKKMYVLAQKVDEYRQQEETIKTALINAQRMGETVVHEARQKGEQIIRDASGKGELLRQQAEHEILNEQKVLEKLHGEVETFKSTMLNLYKQHIESLSALDDTVKNSQAVLDELRSFETTETDVQDIKSDYNPANDSAEEIDDSYTLNTFKV